MLFRKISPIEKTLWVLSNGVECGVLSVTVKSRFVNQRLGPQQVSGIMVLWNELPEEVEH